MARKLWSKVATISEVHCTWSKHDMENPHPTPHTSQAIYTPRDLPPPPLPPPCEVPPTIHHSHVARPHYQLNPADGANICRPGPVKTACHPPDDGSLQCQHAARRTQRRPDVTSQSADLRLVPGGAARGPQHENEANNREFGETEGWEDGHVVRCGRGGPGRKDVLGDNGGEYLVRE